MLPESSNLNPTLQQDAPKLEEKSILSIAYGYIGEEETVFPIGVRYEIVKDGFVTVHVNIIEISNPMEAKLSDVLTDALVGIEDKELKRVVLVEDFSKK